MAAIFRLLICLALWAPLAQAEEQPENAARRPKAIASPAYAEEEELSPNFAGELLAQQLLKRGSGTLKTGIWMHGISPFGDLKYPENFHHFDYVNPKAPKGGTFRQFDTGTFDSLNGFILKGTAVEGLGMVYDTLLEASDDEPFSRYGLLAEKVMVAPDKLSVTFRLRPQAHWNDGEPITAEDVAFSYQMLTTEGHPMFKVYYRDVAAVEVLSPLEVRFVFKNAENRELPLLIGDMPIIPKHFWAGKNFAQSGTATIPLGSGPYRITKVEPGKSIRYERVQDYWGKDLPVNRGKYNFDAVTIDYYRDATVALEAFKANAYDFRQENVARDWARAYDFPAMREGKAKRETIPHALPTGMQGFVFNTRRPFFQDARVREAITDAFDFEWCNKTLFYSLYTRTQSFFSNSFYAASGIPSEKELELLEPYKDAVPPRVFTTPFEAPKSDGSGFNRDNLLKARTLLQQAGWTIKKGKLVNEKGEPFRFQILLSAPTFERVAAPFLKNLRRLGIEATMRTVDSSQYQKRVETYDYDMIMHVYSGSLFPGNEQLAYWQSARADTPGGMNLAGVKNPAIDALAEKIVSAQDLATLIASTRALDRVLLWNYYVIPNWHSRNFRIAYWNKFSRPATAPIYNIGLDTWWDKSAEKQ